MKAESKIFRVIEGQIDNTTKDRKNKLSKVININKSRIAETLDITIDRIPGVGFIKNFFDFLDSVNNKYRKVEIYRFCASLGCTPLELVGYYHIVFGGDMKSGFTNIAFSKIWYRSLYSLYFCKRYNINFNEFVKILKSNKKIKNITKTK